jgi:hypothetical protein
MGGSVSRPGDLWYRCSEYWHKALGRQPRRKRHYISMKKVHRLVGDALRGFLQDPEWLSTLGAPGPPDDRHHRDRDLLLEQVDELVRRRERRMDAYEEGAIELADFSQRIAAIDSQQASLASRLEQLDDAIATAHDREDWLAFAQQTIAEIPDTLPPILPPVKRTSYAPSSPSSSSASLSQMTQYVSSSDGPNILGM